jgi:hypothetical protein
MEWPTSLGAWPLKTPLLLRFEDVHWADADSLALLNHLVEVLTRTPVLITATYRDNEVPADSPLAQLLEELIRRELIVQVKLQGLGQEAVAPFARSLSGHEPTPLFATRLHQWPPRRYRILHGGRSQQRPERP